MKINVSIEGLVPLLQHRFPDEKAELSTIKVKGKRDYSGQVEEALYRDENGIIYEPADHIYSAMIKAGADFKITGRGRKTYKDMMKTAINIIPSAIPLNNQKYEIDRRPVVIQRARVMRERPMFKEWNLDFEIEILDSQLPKEAVKEILEQAGKIGIGDFRPRFGRFMVTKFEEIK